MRAVATLVWLTVDMGVPSWLHSEAWLCMRRLTGAVPHGSGQPAITHVAPYFSQLRTAVTGGSQLTLDTHLTS